ncbi:unnamed protein product [Haemonchus placei]|uniref:ERAP1_C domain-containing protein n=1 Tax=Haemonchus placei TaxID=6290 RepID=A0A0N4WC96_HAEPC|nr:unnamed protein product [Haemonchus placei]
MISWTRRILPHTQICYNAAMRQCSSVNVASEMKEILRIASTGDLKTALSRHEAFRETNDVPDWGVVKLSSVLLANGLEHESESLLKQHYEETGGIHRFARKSGIQEEQVVAALVRVINSTVEDGLDRAHRLYRWLLEGRFCSNKDVFIVLFVERALQSGKYYFDDISICSSKPQALRLTRAGKECGVRGIARARSSFGKFAATIHRGIGCQVVVLESLIELSRLLQFRPQDKAMIYDELVKIYGKHADEANLERITEFVLRESEREHFAATLGRLAHFYRCCHLELPNRLLRAL